MFFFFLFVVVKNPQVQRKTSLDQVDLWDHGSLMDWWVACIWGRQTYKYKVFRTCFGLISGINNTNMVVKVLSWYFLFLVTLCICVLIAVQPCSPLHDRKSRLELLAS